MNHSILLLTIVAAFMAVSAGELPARLTETLDTGWLYTPNDNSDYASKSANEGSFTKVCLPHANVITKHAYQSAAAFQFVSWYRRHFTLPSEYSGKRVFLEFEAVSIVGEVYVNGNRAGGHRGAYTPFTIDITEHVTFGQDNVIAVKVDSRAQSDVPPEGSTIDFMIYGGIVRHVNMIVTDPLRIDWIFVSTDNPSQTKPTAPKVKAIVRVGNHGTSAKNCTVITAVIDAANTVVGTANSSENVSAGGSHEFTLSTDGIANPHLWGIDHPYLYTVHTQLKDGETLLDEYGTRMGIRSLTINKSDGRCYLNGEPFKLRGLNRHETYPYIGRAASRRLQRQDADILKYELGCNIVRTSHYPQAPDFLDRCDEIGLLVLEEVPGWMHIGNTTWRNLQMQVLKDMIVRDRNHPSIMTFGVRVNESPDDNAYYQTMNDTARHYDPTRLTCGVRRGNSDPATSFLEDIWTQNFVNPSTNAPNMPVITTEYCGHNLNPQSHIWDTDNIQISQITDGTYGHAKGHNASYTYNNWGGLLGWCAFDYASVHGNATTAENGRYVSPHGVADLFRLPKIAAWFYQSQRDPAPYGPMVHICNFWTSQSPTNVMVVSNCEAVELFKDGTSLGKKNSGNLYTSLPHPLFSWNATFTAGELKAVGYMGGNEAATHTVHTPGAPSKLLIVPDTSTLYIGGDMTRVVVSLVDSYGQVLYSRSDEVTLSADGAGDFIGEEKVDLEGGQMAFYVKTRASETGTITCNARVGEFSGSASISVVKQEVVSLKQPYTLKATPTSSRKHFQYIYCNNHLSLPSSVVEGEYIQIFDLKGRLLYSTIVQKKAKKLNVNKSSHGIRIMVKGRR